MTLRIASGFSNGANPSVRLPGRLWPPSLAAGTPAPAILEPALARALAKAGPADRFHVIVEMRARTDPHLAAAGATTPLAARRQLVAALQDSATHSQADLRQALRVAQGKGQVERITPFWIFNGLALHDATPALIRTVAARADVAVVRLDHRRSWLRPPNVTTQTERSNAISPTWGIAQIRAPLVWSALQLTGTGVVVASMDTGVDWLHPALREQYRGYDPKGFFHHEGNWFDATGGGALYPVDGHGHGTHVMGIMVGSGGIGVAPGAQWISARVLNGAGIGYDSWIHAGFQWILAPGGDPAKAPDVLNNSWGNDAGGVAIFQDDIAALRAGGILPIFAAGNKGPVPGTVGSPASLPGAFAVGASDEEDEVANFSSRGPSPWGEIRPQIVAPGVNIRSSMPGGTYQVQEGTSMAAPHVAGTVALLRSAKPDLTITETAMVLTRTAVPLTATRPNNDSGWGRLDAYAAAVLVAQAGELQGLVTGDGHPLEGATVTAHRLDDPAGSQPSQATADSAGQYRLMLAPGAYDLTVSAFGYQARVAHNVAIATGEVVMRDFDLPLLPVGTVSGSVRVAGDGTPASVTVAALDTPATTIADPLDGHYSLSLPGGVYTLRVRGLGYRVVTHTVAVTVGETTQQDIELTPTARILLVDGGRWYYDSAGRFYRQTLDELGYVYDRRDLKHIPDDVPVITDLLPYDVLIWSAPDDSPGLVGATKVLSDFLALGNNLLLSGQNIGYWDGGGSGLTYDSFYASHLYAQYVKDNADSRTVFGLPGTLFEGLTMTIAGPGGADNQKWPDVIAVSNPDYAAPVLQYAGDGSAGQQVGLCKPYRTLYLAFGFEGINDTATRRSVMDKSLAWFAHPRQVTGLEVSTTNSSALIGLPGTVVTHVVRIRNTGEAGPGNRFRLSLTGADWPVTVLSPTLDLAPCASANVALRVTIPYTATWDQSDQFTLTVRSTFSPTLFRDLPLVSKAPAPLLLVDDDRWYPQEAVYEEALAATGIPYDRWDVGQQSFGAGSPPTDTLRRYPIVLWFTGYDWFDPLQPSEEDRLVAYLQQGGRLFLSAQDYLYYGYGSSLARDYFGVLTFTEWITPTQAIGVPGDPVGAGDGPLALSFPFPNFSDRVVPTSTAHVVYRDQVGRGIGLRQAGSNWRTLFFAFPFETLPPADRPPAMARIVGWLSWLGDSTLRADRDVVSAGEQVTYTITLRHDGPTPIARATLSNTLPPGVRLIAGSLSSNATYDPAARRIGWAGPLAPGQRITVWYRVETDESLPAGTQIGNVAHVQLEDYSIGFDRSALVRVDAPDLGDSRLSLVPPVAGLGQVVTLTFVSQNNGLHDAPMTTVRWPLPPGMTWISGTFSTSIGGVVIASPDLLSWSGNVPRHVPVTLTVQVRPLAVAEEYPFVPFTAILDDGMGGKKEKSAWLRIGPNRLWFPLVFQGSK